jgi:hypothetical protein
MTQKAEKAEVRKARLKKICEESRRRAHEEAIVRANHKPRGVAFQLPRDPASDAA